MYLNRIRGCLLARPPSLFRSPCSMLCTRSMGRLQQVQQQGELKGLREIVSDGVSKAMFNMGQYASFSRSEENPALMPGSSPAVNLKEEAQHHNEVPSVPGSGPAKNLQEEADHPEMSSMSGSGPAENLQEEADHPEKSIVPGSGPPAVTGVLRKKDRMFYGLTIKELYAMTKDERLMHMQEYDERLMHMQESLVEEIKRTLENTELSEENRESLKHDLRNINTDLQIAKKFGIVLHSTL